MRRLLTLVLLACVFTPAHAERWLTLATSWPMYEGSIDPASLRVEGHYRHVRLRIALLRPQLALAHPELKWPVQGMRDLEIADFRANCTGMSYLAGDSVAHLLQGGTSPGTGVGNSVALNGLGDQLTKRICALDPQQALKPLLKINARSYADVASAWRTGDTSSMWMVFVLDPPQGGAKSVRGLLEFNCAEQESRSLTGIYMSAPLGEGDILETVNGSEPWKPVNGDLLAAACDKP